MNDTPPKLFISYSWSNPDYEERILSIAKRLVDNGVDVIFDKWELKDGHDINYFMEQMVNNPNIGKVAIFSDKKYVEKSNERYGGVGTEAQIITPSLYGKSKQDKFVLVVMERDAEGEVFQPTYYKGLKFIDFDRPEIYESEFEKLLRWIFNEPFLLKPPLGKKPSFSKESELIQINAENETRLIFEAIEEDKSNKVGRLKDYLAKYALGLSALKAENNNEQLDEEIMIKIRSFTDNRESFIKVIDKLYGYSENNVDFIDEFLKFFETLMLNTQGYDDPKFDHFRFIILELFLSFCAILLRHEKFIELNKLLGSSFYIPEYYNTKDSFNFTVFNGTMRIFDARKQRLKLSEYDLIAKELKNQFENSILRFDEIMQADFILYLFSEFGGDSKLDGRWYPHTVAYLGYSDRPLKIFAKSINREYYLRMLSIFSGTGIGMNIQNYISKLASQKTQVVPIWTLAHDATIKSLCNFDNLPEAPSIGSFYSLGDN